MFMFITLIKQKQNILDLCNSKFNFVAFCETYFTALYEKIYVVQHDIKASTFLYVDPAESWAHRTKQNLLLL